MLLTIIFMLIFKKICCLSAASIQKNYISSGSALAEDKFKYYYVSLTICFITWKRIVCDSAQSSLSWFMYDVLVKCSVVVSIPVQLRFVIISVHINQLVFIFCLSFFCEMGGRGLWKFLRNGIQENYRLNASKNVQRDGQKMIMDFCTLERGKRENKNCLD